MALFRVRIVCWCEPDTKGDPLRRKSEQRIFLVEGENSKAAIATALEYAEKTARFGPMWVGFEFREANTVILPYEL